MIFEGQRLIDWGITNVRGSKNKVSIAAASDLISRYRPQIMILEDVVARHCRRCPRVHELIEALGRYGRERGLTVRKISQITVKRSFEPLGITRTRWRGSSPRDLLSSRATFHLNASPG